MSLKEGDSYDFGTLVINIFRAPALNEGRKWPRPLVNFVAALMNIQAFKEKIQQLKLETSHVNKILGIAEEDIVAGTASLPAGTSGGSSSVNNLQLGQSVEEIKQEKLLAKLVQLGLEEVTAMQIVNPEAFQKMEHLGDLHSVYQGLSIEAIFQRLRMFRAWNMARTMMHCWLSIRRHI